MDGERFDSFVRQLGMATSRRNLLKGLFGGAAAVATTAVAKEATSAAGAGEYCGGIDPPGPVVLCDSGLYCCAIASPHGICLTAEQCSNPALIACTTGAQCPGNFACCGDGFCSSDYFGECPTTTTPTPTTTTTPATTTTTPAATTTTPAPTSTTSVPTTTTSNPTTPAPNTVPGTFVEVTFPGIPGASITFGTVSIGGVTTITPIAISSLPSLPDSSMYAVVDGVWYEISSTAVWDLGATVCLPSSDPDDRILHYEGGEWVDFTDPAYPTGGVVCGAIASFSPFAVVPLLETNSDDDDDDDHDSDDDDDDDHHGGKPHPPKPDSPKDEGVESIDRLPSTGSGPAAANNAAWLGLTLAASAAAAAAARTIRSTESTES